MSGELSRLKPNVVRTQFTACEFKVPEERTETNTLPIRVYFEVSLNNDFQKSWCDINYLLGVNSPEGDTVDLIALEPALKAPFSNRSALQVSIQWCMRTVIGSEAKDIITMVVKEAKPVRIEFSPPNIYDYNLNEY
jgi:hypothetical protein